MKKHFAQVLRDQAGTSVTEFGLIAPVIAVMVMGVMDVSHSYYTEAVLNSAIQRAGRSSALEGAYTATQQSLIDYRVQQAVKKVAPSATVNVARRYYKTFSDASAAQAEAWTDTNQNRKCDNDEPYIDENNNNVWDADGGDEGQGGARDVVIIKVNVSYPRLFPTEKLLGFGQDVQLLSDSILANQPYAAQTVYGASQEGQCS